MAWDDTQTSTDDITYVEWNNMVTYIKSAISALNSIDVGTFKINGTTITSTATELNILDGVTVSFTEINYLSGVSSNIQTQINNKTGNSETDLSSKSWFLDEDTLVSDDATKVASQQSIKAYVDSNAGINNLVEDTTPELGGNLSLNTFSIKIEQTQSLSGDYESLHQFTGTAGEALSQFEVVVLKSDGKYDKAQANTDANVKGKCAIVLDSSISLDATGNFAGGPTTIKNTSWAFTVGAQLFISTATAGAITETVPSTTGDRIRCIGYAISSDTIMFDPEKSFYEVA